MKKIIFIFLLGIGLQSCSSSNGNSNCNRNYTTIVTERIDIKLQNGSSRSRIMPLFKATLPDGHSYLIATQFTDGSGDKSLCHDPECSKCKTK